MDPIVQLPSSEKRFSFAMLRQPRILILGLVLIATTIFLAKFINDYIYRSRADLTNPVTVTVSPSTANVQKDARFTVDILLQPEASKKISALDLGLEYSTNLARLESVTHFGYFSDEVINTPATTSQPGRIVLTAKKSDAELTPNNVNVVKVTLTFQTLATGTFNFNLLNSNYQIVGTNGTGPISFGIAPNSTLTTSVVISAQGAGAVNTYSPIYVKKWPFADGKKQHTNLIISNPHDTPTAVTIRVMKLDGSGEIGSLGLMLPAKGMWDSFGKPEWYNLNGNNPEIGWVLLNSSQSVEAVNRTTIRASDAFNSEIFFFDDEKFTDYPNANLYAGMYTKRADAGDTQKKQFTNVTIVNPGSNVATVTLNLFRADGSQIGTIGNITVPAKASWTTEGKPEWTNMSGTNVEQGWIHVTSTVPVVAMTRSTMNGGDAPDSSVSAFDDELLTATSARGLYGSLFLRNNGNVGQKQFSDLFITNPNTAPVTVTVKVYNASSEVGEIGTIQNITIPAKGMWSSTGKQEWINLGGIDPKAGWIQLIASQPVIAMGRMKILAGDTYTSSVISFEDEYLTAYPSGNLNLVPFLRKISTGDNLRNQFNHVMITNPNSAPANVTLDLYVSGAKVDSMNVVVGGFAMWNSYTSTDWNTLGTNTPIGGWVKISSDRAVVVTNRMSFRTGDTYQAALFALDDEPVNAISSSSQPPEVLPTLAPQPTPTPQMACNNNNQCGANASCANGGCTCNPGFYNCDGTFTNGCESSTQCPTGGGGPISCGDMNNICLPGQSCENNRCVPADMTLKLKLKIQGNAQTIPVESNKLRVKVSVTNGTINKSNYATFTSLGGGLWEGTVGFNGIPAGGNYAILVKGERHLQKKICEQTPKETTDGTYTCTDYAESFITLKKGENILDFSGVYHLAGDLPVGGSQNGVIDSVDLTFLRSKMSSQNAGDLSIGDTYIDRIIDSQDHSLPIKVFDLGFNTDDE